MTVRERAVGAANARLLGVIRVGVGIAALMELVPSAQRLLMLGAADVVRLPILGPSGWLVQNAAALLIGIWLLCGLAFAFGLMTRAAGVALAATLFVVVTGDEQLYSNHSYLLAIVVTILTAGNAGSAFSIDARRRGTDGLPSPAWPLTAIRVQVSIVYLFTAVAKLNPSFLSGSVIANALRRDGPLPWPEAWLTFEAMFVLSVLVVSAELFLAVGLWRRRWRPAAFLIGLLLHVGIVLVMNHAWDLAVFSVLTLSLYVAFADAGRASRVVVWDDTCSFCGTWVTWFRRLDWLDALRFVPRSQLAASNVPISEDAAIEAMHVVGPRGVTRGFAAVTEVLSVLPLSFLWAAVLRVAPLARLGERAYRAVARSRTCPVGLPGAPTTTAG